MLSLLMSNVHLQFHIYKQIGPIQLVDLIEFSSIYYQNFSIGFPDIRKQPQISCELIQYAQLGLAMNGH